MSSISKLAWFAGGALFGSVGLKILATKEAKKVYVRAAALGLRAKDSVMDTVTVLQENAADILVEAQDYNDERAEKLAAEEAEAEIADAVEFDASTEAEEK